MTIIPIGSGVCLASVVCSVEPAAQDVITGVTIDFTNALIDIGNADGSILTGMVDSWSLAPTGDDESDNYVLSVQGTLYNADGSIFGTYDAELTGQLTDSGSLVITSGTLTENAVTNIAHPTGSVLHGTPPGPLGGIWCRRTRADCGPRNPEVSLLKTLYRRVFKRLQVDTRRRASMDPAATRTIRRTNLAKTTRR